METQMELKPPAEYTSPTASIWQDVLAQAVTGELVAAMDYAALAEICDDPREAGEGRAHAAIERAHAAAFMAAGGKIGVDVVSKVDGKQWKRLCGALHESVGEVGASG